MAAEPITGAMSLMRTMAASGIDVCFANPGTSEMHFVAALGAIPRIRPVLGLFEGGVTGMADGYARITGRPAMTLMHLGPGIGHGIANLHNARRAHSPIVNVVGDHATYHKRWDSPLKSDLEAIARPVSDWLRMADSPDRLSADGAQAVAAARTRPGQIATLLLPADVAWGSTTGHSPALPVPAVVSPDEAGLRDVASILRRSGNRAALLVCSAAADARGLSALRRICACTGARPLADMVAARHWRGSGVYPVTRIPYRAEAAVEVLKGLSDLVLVGAPPPVAPFAYPNYPSWLTPEGATLTTLCDPTQDEVAVLEALAELLGAPRDLPAIPASLPIDRPSGRLDAATIGGVLARWMPEGAILSEESISNAPPILQALSRAAPHLHLTNTGGALGQGIPLATGAAVAAPNRKVVNLQADGSAMFTLQALWTQAREQLDVVTVILANRSYAVLRAEVERVGARVEPSLVAGLLDIGSPDLDWISLARGMGVESVRVADARSFEDCLASVQRRRGPFLIEAVMPT
ncbi:MAG: putative acetolactate synthase large subunit IlvX [Pseudomonadota bacterium]|jgi:acetolactate synthase-1/2/3 large subunit